MGDIAASVYVRCKSKAQLSSVKSYLDIETKPDFVDDLPDKNEDLFRLIEQSTPADGINIVSDTELELFFEYDAFSEKEELPKLLNAIDCEQAV